MSAPFSNPDTSKAAADDIEPYIGKREKELLAWITANGAATDQAMQDSLGWAGSYQRPARCGLVDKGLVRDTGERGKTKSGRRAILWDRAAI